MVHKKFIERDGKTYGPYFYESYREDGRVKKRYIENPSNGLSRNKILASVFLIFIFLFILGGVWYIIDDTRVTGKVTADISPEYVLGEKLSGTLKFNLRAGELVPQDSKVTLTLGNEQKELLLSEVSIKAKLETGTFYAENVSLFGSGDGYGVLGEKTIVPEIDFQLLVSESDSEIALPEAVSDDLGVGSGGSEVEEESSEDNEVSEEDSEIVIEEEENVNAESEIIIEDEEVSGENAEESNANENSAENSNNGNSNEDSAKEDKSDKEDKGKTKNSGYGSLISGNIVIEGAYTLDGTVSTEKEYTYTLEEGQEAELVKGSVLINGEIVDDSIIKVKQKGNEVIVTTNYELVEEGYGEEYLGDYKLSLKIDLSVFNISVNDERVSIKLDYQDQTIAAATALITVVNESGEVIESNDTAPVLLQEFGLVRLTVNDSTSLNLDNYFSGADRFTFTIQDISSSISSNELTLTSGDVKGARIGTLTAHSGTASTNADITVLVSSGALQVKTTRSQVRLGEPVKWIQNITLDTPENISIEIPSVAENITVNKIEDGEEIVVQSVAIETKSLLTGDVVAEIEITKDPKLIAWLKNVYKSITGRVVTDLGDEFTEVSAPSLDQALVISLNDSAQVYTIEYETPAPEAFETITAEGKQVIISDPNELGYTDVLSYTNLPEVLAVGQESFIQLYWVENNSYLPFDAYDLTGNNLLDYMEWITPHLSNQTFNIVFSSGNASYGSNITFEGAGSSEFSHLSLNSKVDTVNTGYGIIAYHSFDKDNRTNTFDYSVNNLNGNMSANANITSTNCVYGSCLILDGTNDVVSIADSSLWQFNNFTIALWVKVNSAMGNNWEQPAWVAQDAGSGSNHKWILSYDEATSQTLWHVNNVGVGATTVRSGTWTRTLGTWYHVVIARNGTTINFYVNGAPNGTATDSIATPNVAASLVLGHGEGAGYLNGSIDEFMIYNYTLNSSQVNQIYQNTSKRFVTKGEIEFKQFNITVGRDNVSIYTQQYERKLGTNISLRIGQWNISKGYNLSDINSSANRLVAYYNFDNISSLGENQTFVADRTGRNNGTVIGGNQTINNGVYSRAIQFDGSNDYVNVPTSNFPTGSNALSYSLWFKYSSATSQRVMIYYGTNAVGQSYYIEVGNTADCGANKLSVGKWGTTINCASDTLSADTWYHAAAVWNGSSSFLYRDGVLVDSDVSTLNLVNTYANIGRVSTGAYFIGLMDEVMIFNRSLSAEEVRELHVKGRALWNYTSYQNLTSQNSNDNSSANNFVLESGATNILPSFRLESDSNQFYTPILPATISTGTSGAGQASSFDQWVDVGSCGILGLNNTMYRLNMTLHSTGTCLQVWGSNVTIDGNGNTIYFGNSSTSSVYGIQLSATAGVYEQNVTIQNIKIERPTGVGTTIYGIFSNLVYNVTVENTTVVVNGTGTQYAIYSNGAGNHVFRNNNLTVYTSASTADTSIGIRGNAGSFNTFSDNYIQTQADVGSYGIYLEAGSSYNRIENNTINSNGTSISFAIANTAWAHSIIANNTVNVSAYYDCAGLYGASTGAFNNTFSDNNGYDYGDSCYGLLIINPGSTVIIERNRFNVSADGYHFYAGSVNFGSRINVSQNNLVWGRNVTIYGGSSLDCPDNTVIDNSNSGHISLLGCNNVNITNYDNSNGQKDSIWFYQATLSQIANNTAIGVPLGARIFFGGNNTISNSTFDVNGAEFASQNFGGFGIWIESPNNTIQRNNVTTNSKGDTAHGIYDASTISAGNRLTKILDNTVVTNGTTTTYGIFSHTSLGNSTIINNTVRTGTGGTTLNNYGILAYSHGVQIHNNTIVTNGTSGNVGLYLFGNQMNATGNIVFTDGSAANNWGINLPSASRDNFVEYNIVMTKGSSTNYGIFADTTFGNNIIRYNNVTTFAPAGGSNYGIYLASTYNNTLAYNIINTTGTIDNEGIALSTSQNNTILGNIIQTNGTTNSSDGFYLINRIRNNLIVNNTLVSIKGDGFRFDRFSAGFEIENNTLWNNEFVSISAVDVYFIDASMNGTMFKNQPVGNMTFTGVGSLIDVENTNYANVRFLQLVNGSIANFSQSIFISNSTVNINETDSRGGLNKSANLTFYNQPTRTTFYRDGVECTAPTCNNLTSLNAGTIVYNVSIAGNYSFVAAGAGDTTAPNVTIVNPTSATYNSSSIVFNITLSEAGSANFSIDNGVTNYSMTANSSSTGFNYTLSGITSGIYTLRAYGFDTNGNANLTANRTFNVDTINPTISFIGQTPANASTQTATSIAVNVSSNGTLPGLVNSDHYTFANFDNSLVGWWTMDRGNTTYVIDDSGNQHNLTATGVTSPNASGIYGNSREFDATTPGSQGIVTGTLTGSGLTGNPNFTVSTWINLRNVDADDRGILGWGATGTSLGAAGFYIANAVSDGSKELVFAYAGANSAYSANLNITANTWYHIVYTKTSGNIAGNSTFYVNGQNIGTLSGSSSTPNIQNLNFAIGRWANLADDYNHGRVDEVLIFNRTLTAAEAAALYNASVNKYYNNFTGLSTGSHTFQSYSVDSAGNRNSTELRTVTISVADTTAPNVSIVYPTNTSYTRIITEINYTSSTDSQACWYSINGGVTNTTVVCGVNVTGLTSTQDGNTWRVGVNDSSGNINTTSVSFSVDSLVPNTTFVTPTPSANQTLSANNFVVNVTSADSHLANITVRLYNGSHSLLQTNVSTVSPNNISYSGLANGLYWFNATGTDSFNNQNNTETRNITIAVDNTNPAVTNLIANPANASQYQLGANYSFNATVTDSSAISNVIFSFNGVNYSTSANGNVYNATVSNLAAGNYNYYWYANDTSGNVNQTSTGSYTVSQATGMVYTYLNNTRANISIIQGDSIYLNATLINGTGNIILYNNGSLINNASLIVSNLTTFNTLGMFNITAEYSGNNNFTSDIEVWYVNVTQAADTTRPGVTIHSPANQSYISGSMNFSVSLTENGSVNFSLDNGITNYSMTANASNTGFNITNFNLTAGSYTFRVYALDLAGNRNETESVVFSYRDYMRVNVSLNRGWNMFGLVIPGQNSSNGDRNVSVSRGWNLVGYSSTNPTSHTDLDFVNASESITQDWSTAANNQKAQYQLAYFNNTGSARGFKYVPSDESQLVYNKAYWVYSNESGNVSLPNVGGSYTNASYAWKDLHFTNGSTQLNITDAFTAGWIGVPGQTVSSLIRTWDTQTGYIALDSSESLSSWDGYVIWSRNQNVSLVVQA